MGPPPQILFYFPIFYNKLALLFLFFKQFKSTWMWPVEFLWVVLLLNEKNIPIDVLVKTRKKSLRQLSNADTGLPKTSSTEGRAALPTTQDWHLIAGLTIQQPAGCPDPLHRSPLHRCKFTGRLPLLIYCWAGRQALGSILPSLCQHISLFLNNLSISKGKY